MPVTAERRAFITREQAIDTRSDATIKTRHLGARDTGPQPRLAYWDTIADAAAMNIEGFALLSPERRGFGVEIPEVIEFTDDLDYSQETPTVTLVDDEQKVDGDHLIARIEVDLETEATTLEVFG